MHETVDSFSSFNLSITAFCKLHWPWGMTSISATEHIGHNHICTRP